MERRDSEHFDEEYENVTFNTGSICSSSERKGFQHFEFEASENNASSRSEKVQFKLPDEDQLMKKYADRYNSTVEFQKPADKIVTIEVETDCESDEDHRECGNDSEYFTVEKPRQGIKENGIDQEVNSGVDIQQHVVNSGVDIQQQEVNSGFDIQQQDVSSGADIQQHVVNSGVDIQQQEVNSGVDIQQQDVSSGADIQQHVVNSNVDIKQQVVNSNVDIQQHVVNYNVDIKQQVVKSDVDIKKQVVKSDVDIKQQVVSAGVDIKQQVVSAGVDIQQQEVNAGVDIQQQEVNAGVDTQHDETKRRRRKKRKDRNSKKEIVKCKDSGVESDQSIDIVRKLKKRNKRHRKKTADLTRQACETRTLERHFRLTESERETANECLKVYGHLNVNEGAADGLSMGQQDNDTGSVNRGAIYRPSVPPLENISEPPDSPVFNMFYANQFNPSRANNSSCNITFVSPKETKADDSKKKLKLKKPRDLKKTSSKVAAIVTTPLPPKSSRLDIEKTARSQTGADFEQSLSDNELEEGAVKDPLAICKLITRFPTLCFLFLTAIHLAIIGITIGLVFSGKDVFPAVFDTLPLYLYNEPRLKELSWRSRNSYDGHIYRPVYGYAFNSGYRGQIKDTFEVIFERPNDNILTKKHLKLIKKAEDELFLMDKYRNDFCLLNNYYTCIKPQSLMRLFDGSFSHVDPIFNDPNFTSICDVINKADFYNETHEYLELFIGKDSVITPNKCSTSITRSMFFVGWPLYVINGHYGTEVDIQLFLANYFKPAVEDIRDFDLVEIMDVYYLSKLLYEYDLVQQALTDIKLALGSFLFILVFMCCQTGSIVVTFLGIMSILSSFLLTNLFYRYVLHYRYFGFFHVIAIFLILGIGADDLFVFYDTWRLTGHNEYPSDAHRLSDCYRKAAKTTFVTSVTTMVAFLVSGLSPLLPVKTFGIFSGILIILNYIWVVLYFPTIIMLHHTKSKYIWKWIRDLFLSVFIGTKKAPGFPCRRQSVSSASSSANHSISETNSTRNLLPNSDHDNHNAGRSEVSPTPSTSSETSTNTSHTQVPSISKTVFLQEATMKDRPYDQRSDLKIDLVADDDDSFQHHVPTTLDLKKIECEAQREDYIEKKKKKRKKNFEDRNVVVKFLKNGFFDLMTKRGVKIVVPMLFLGVSIFFIHRATLIQPDTQQLKLFRSTHNYAKATDRHYSSFQRNLEDEYQRVYLVWGIRESDISACDQKSGDYCFGQPAWDDNFDMNTREAQLAFKDLCYRLENMESSIAEKLRIRKGSFGGLKIHCFTSSFEDFFQDEVNQNSYPVGTDLSLPITPGNVTRLTNRYSYIYQNSLPSNFENYFEVLTGYWLTNGYSLYPTQGYIDYNDLLGEQIVQGTTSYAFYDYSGLYYGTKLKYLAIEINTTMNVFNMGYEEGLPIYEQWEQLISDINDRMPPSLQNGLQVAENLWHWLFVQKTLSDSAITGIVVGLLSAWPILIVTTLNFVIGTIAAVTIGLVTACVIGLIPLAGWKLGVLESINLCMVVGLSVDYIVHLAEAYRSSKSTRRADRVHDMLESIGLSVVSGAITTMGAAAFMLFAKIQFFFQFGIFIISTVGISLIFSLLGFTTLLSLCGPEGNTGCLKAFARGCVKFCSKKENSVDDSENKGRKSCPCVSPAVLMERCYDWFGYGNID